MQTAMDTDTTPATKTRDADGRTPLHHAAITGDVEAIAQLLAQGANIEAVDDAKWTPLICAASAGRAGAVALLLHSKAAVNARTATGTTALTHAAGKGHLDVVNALLAAGADPAVQDHSGSSALHRSAGVGAAEVLRALCVAAPRSALELVDKLGCTPFHVSVEERREECVMVLAEAGANIRCKNSAGEVALESVPARIREQIE